MFDVEEVFESAYTVAPHPDKPGRFVVNGFTKGLRDLEVIVRHKGGSLIRVITAYGPGEGD